MKNILICVFVIFFNPIGGFSQIVNLEIVEVINSNKEEAIFYYQKNWKELRKMALERNQIVSYSLLISKKDSSEIVLTTEYAADQFEKSEENFQVLIKEISPAGPKFLNSKRSYEFRKRKFTKIYHRIE